jgi:hypothetical protein
MRLSRILAELQITAAPESAIRHALAQVSEETTSLLESATRTAEEMTSRSRAEADQHLERAAREAKEQQTVAAEEARQVRAAADDEANRLREAAAKEAHTIREAAQREANEVRQAAEKRVRELEADAQSIAGERLRQIEGLRELTRGLDAYLDSAEQRFADLQPAPPSQKQPPQGKR